MRKQITRSHFTLRGSQRSIWPAGELGFCAGKLRASPQLENGDGTEQERHSTQLRLAALQKRRARRERYQWGGGDEDEGAHRAAQPNGARSAR